MKFNSSLSEGIRQAMKKRWEKRKTHTLKRLRSKGSEKGLKKLRKNCKIRKEYQVQRELLFKTLKLIFLLETKYTNKTQIKVQNFFFFNFSWFSFLVPYLNHLFFCLHNLRYMKNVKNGENYDLKPQKMTLFCRGNIKVRNMERSGCCSSQGYEVVCEKFMGLS